MGREERAAQRAEKAGKHLRTATVFDGRDHWGARMSQAQREVEGLKLTDRMIELTESMLEEQQKTNRLLQALVEGQPV